MKVRACLTLAAAMLVIGGAVYAQGAPGFTVTINVDENGNGTLVNSTGFFANLPWSLAPDPGPGGLSSVLTYDLLNPPGLVSGDVLLSDVAEGGAILDVVRFNGDEVLPSGNVGALLFYSDNIDGFDAIADTPGPPGAFYPNNITIPEVGPEGNNFAVYTPLPGQPGFVAGADGPVTYILVSDVPEPGTLGMLLGSGIAGSMLLFRLRRRA